MSLKTPNNYRVTVVRKSKRVDEFEVEASCAKEAKEIALQEALYFDFSDSREIRADYVAEKPQRLDPKT